MATADRGVRSAPRFLIVEDSPVFRALAASTLRMAVPGAQVVECESFDDATGYLAATSADVMVCGYGLGDGRTVHDMRRVTDTPMVVLTGRLGELQMPERATLVEKSAGPTALADAVMGYLDPQSV